MTSLRDALVTLATVSRGSRSSDTVEYVGIVSSVRGDNTVNLQVRGGTLFGVRCLASYTTRAVGDVVVSRKSRTGWVVVGKTGAESVPVEELTPPLTITAADVGTWRGNQRSEDIRYAMQGASNGDTGSNTGAWFYGTAVHDAVAAGNATVAVELVRQPGPHGHNGAVPVQLYTHPHATAPLPEPSRLNGPYNIGTFELGQWRIVTLPAAAAVSLAAGGYGLLAYSAAKNHVRFTATSGTVRVTYT